MARLLRGGEDITQSSIQQFYPGLVGLAIKDIDDEPIELIPKHGNERDPNEAG